MSLSMTINIFFCRTFIISGFLLYIRGILNTPSSFPISHPAASRSAWKSPFDSISRKRPKKSRSVYSAFRKRSLAHSTKHDRPLEQDLGNGLPAFHLFQHYIVSLLYPMHMIHVEGAYALSLLTRVSFRHAHKHFTVYNLNTVEMPFKMIIINLIA